MRKPEDRLRDLELVVKLSAPAVDAGRPGFDEGADRNLCRYRSQLRNTLPAHGLSNCPTFVGGVAVTWTCALCCPGRNAARAGRADAIAGSLVGPRGGRGTSIGYWGHVEPHRRPSLLDGTLWSAKLRASSIVTYRLSLPQNGEVEAMGGMLRSWSCGCFRARPAFHDRSRARLHDLRPGQPCSIYCCLRATVRTPRSAARLHPVGDLQRHLAKIRGFTSPDDAERSGVF